QAFLAYGFDSNTDAPRLLLAARGASMVELLGAYGADVNANSRNGLLTPLMLAARRGDAGAVRALLESGADVNAIDSTGTTALMGAAEVGSPDVVRLLLAAGALYQVSNSQGYTALQTATRASFDEPFRKVHREHLQAAGFHESTPDFATVIE